MKSLTSFQLFKDAGGTRTAETSTAILLESLEYLQNQLEHAYKKVLEEWVAIIHICQASCSCWKGCVGGEGGI
jgi:hypothetical protein